ncbi:MAG TPA: mismatch-specific DNA-glycosylase [Thiotrichales bacterium]|nr:mismatch-specific DNA-glycosylase [Thiotrichales bacterium]
MKTLPDYLAPGLRLVSVGLNPSLPSVRAGFYFANPRNRFWKALAASGLADCLGEGWQPGPEAVERLFRECGMGFTDLVKRPTAGVKDLRAADFREGARVLEEKLLAAAPCVVWFHGKMAWRAFLKYRGPAVDDIPWGRQKTGIGDALVYVTPNSSPANAAFSLDDLVAWYRKLDRLQRRLCP